MSRLDSIEEFVYRIHHDWLPAYCADKHRKFETRGFNLSSIKVSEIDAADFIRAIDLKIVTDKGGGRYLAAKSAAIEVIFWAGNRIDSPRTISLWLEPIITIAAAARLHINYGWPKECIGLQSKRWGFDFVAYASAASDQEFIMGEVKKSGREVDKLISDLKALSTNPGITDISQLNVSNNSFKKWTELLSRRPKVVWVLGPAATGVIFNISYPNENSAVLTEGNECALTYKNSLDY